MIINDDIKYTNDDSLNINENTYIKICFENPISNLNSLFDSSNDRA